MGAVLAGQAGAGLYPWGSVPDPAFLATYFGRLGAIDPAAAEGFRKVLQGISVTV